MIKCTTQYSQFVLSKFESAKHLWIVALTVSQKEVDDLSLRICNKELLLFYKKRVTAKRKKQRLRSHE